MDLRGRWRRNAAAQGIFEDCEKFFVHIVCLLNYYCYLCGKGSGGKRAQWALDPG